MCSVSVSRGGILNHDHSKFWEKGCVCACLCVCLLTIFLRSLTANSILFSGLYPRIGNVCQLNKRRTFYLLLLISKMVKQSTRGCVSCRAHGGVGDGWPFLKTGDGILTLFSPPTRCNSLDFKLLLQCSITLLPPTAQRQSQITSSNVCEHHHHATLHRNPFHGPDANILFPQTTHQRLLRRSLPQLAPTSNPTRIHHSKTIRHCPLHRPPSRRSPQLEHTRRFIPIHLANSSIQGYLDDSIPYYHTRVHFGTYVE